MSAAGWDTSRRLGAALLILGLGTAAITGWLVSTLPLPVLVLSLGAPVLLVVGSIWPLPALVVTAALLYEVVPSEYLMKLGSFRVHELLIGYLALVVAVRAILRSEPLASELKEFRWPLAYLLACLSMSVVYAYYFAGNAFLLAELRSFITWLLLPALLLAVRNERDQRVMIGGMMGIAIAMATIVIMQSVFNVKLLTEARVESLDTITNSDVTRSVAGGATYLIAFTLYYCINLLSARRGPALLLILCCVWLAAGLAVTFGRGVWMATAVGLLVATFFNRGMRGVMSAVAVGSLVVASVLALGAIVKPRMVEAVVERATGIGEELDRGGSYRWRALENAAALRALESRPFTGVGLGGDYKLTISSIDSFSGETWYIHNAYMGYAVKMGWHAALYPFWMILCFVWVARRVWKFGPPHQRPLQAALIGAFFVPVVTSYTQPEWLNPGGIASFSFIIAALLISGRPAVQERVA
jgi:O-antigen ligase